MKPLKFSPNYRIKMWSIQKQNHFLQLLSILLEQSIVNTYWSVLTPSIVCVHQLELKKNTYHSVCQVTHKNISYINDFRIQCETPNSKTYPKSCFCRYPDCQIVFILSFVKHVPLYYIPNETKLVAMATDSLACLPAYYDYFRIRSKKRRRDNCKSFPSLFKIFSDSLFISLLARNLYYGGQRKSLYKLSVQRYKVRVIYFNSLFSFCLIFQEVEMIENVRALLKKTMDQAHEQLW